MGNTVTIGGREFQPLTDSTIEQDFFVMRHVRAAGIDGMTIDAGETADQFANRMLEKALESGRMFHILSGLLVPAGMDPNSWTPALAEDTAEFLRTRTAPEDKAVIRGQVASTLVGFIQAGLTLYATSPRFSASPAADSESANAGR